MILNILYHILSTVENRRRRTSVSLGKRAQQLRCAAERSAKLLKLPPLSFVFSEDEFCACEQQSNLYLLAIFLAFSRASKEKVSLIFYNLLVFPHVNELYS